jgi:hypothetical protein
MKKYLVLLGEACLQLTQGVDLFAEYGIIQSIPNSE